MQQITAKEKELLSIIQNSKDPVKTFEYALALICAAHRGEDLKKIAIKDK